MAPGLGHPRDWVPWIRLAAAPFALLEVAVERGNYPSGHERWAWGLAVGFAVAASALAAAGPRPPAAAAGLALDLGIASGFVCLYGFEPSSPVRGVLVLVVIEAALLFRRPGGVVAALATAPALAVFEARAADRLDVPFDAGHVLGPVGVSLVAGLVVGALAGDRAKRG